MRGGQQIKHPCNSKYQQVSQTRNLDVIPMNIINEENSAVTFGCKVKVNGLSFSVNHFIIDAKVIRSSELTNDSENMDTKKYFTVPKKSVFLGSTHPRLL